MNTFDYVDLGGDIRYVKDSAGQAMLAPEETSTTASKAYAVGDLFRYDGKLYRVSAAIAANGTITIGTNCIETTIEEEINRAKDYAENQIVTATESWLEDNISTGDTVVDASLSIAGAAADAAAVGNLKSAIIDLGNTTDFALTDVYEYPFVFKNGYFNANGVVTAQGAEKQLYTNRVKLPDSRTITVKLSHSTSHSTMWIVYCTYAADGTFIERVAIKSSANFDPVNTRLVLPSAAYYIAFSFASYDDYTFSVTVESTIKNNAEAVARTAHDLSGTGILVDVSANLTAGIINGNGTIGAQSTSYYQVYTDYIPISVGMTCTPHITLRATKNMWIAYAVYDERKTFLYRETLVNNVSGSDFDVSFVMQTERAKYIRVTFNTYNILKYATIVFQSSGDVYYRKKNLFAFVDSSRGYIDSPAGTVNIAQSNGNTVSDAIPVTAGIDYTILFSFIGNSSINPGLRYCWYDSNGTKIADPTTVTIDASIRYTSFTQAIFVTAPTGAASIRIAFGMFDSGRLSFYEGRCYAAYTLNEKDLVELSRFVRYPTYATGNHFVKAIAHRGAPNSSGTPENTIPAFIMAKKYGFEYCETDVAKTSDGEYVLLHDTSINRTARNADGTTISSTVNIADITYEQALTYDFGIAAGARFAGTKIPKLSEFLACCKAISLHPYIELKAATLTTEDITDIIGMVKSYGMLRDVTWAGNATRLEAVKNVDPKARLCYAGSSASAEIVETLQALKTNDNEVVFSGEYADHSSYQLLIDAGIPIEAWTLNTKAAILSINPYVTGVFSDNLAAWQVLGEPYFKQYTY